MLTKICCKCKVEKGYSEFSKNRARHDGLNSDCKACYREYKRQYYLKNEEKYKEKIHNRRRELFKWLEEYKASLKCEKCGFAHPAAMDFHHEGDKDFQIGDAVKQGYSKERILEEISKCKVLCCRCHRILHWEIRRMG